MAQPISANIHNGPTSDTQCCQSSYYLSSHCISCHSDGHEANEYGMWHGQEL